MSINVITIEAINVREIQVIIIITMRKLVLLLAFVFLVCAIPGGFTPVDSNDLPSLANNDLYKSAEAKAREVFEEQHNSALGDVISVEQQIVSGINYKITFQSPEGVYDVVVYSQPWTQTIKVIDIQKH